MGQENPLFDTIHIHLAVPSEYSILGEIMYEAVRNGQSKYTEQQREAWVPEARSGKEWNERLASQAVFVASDSAQSLGFMSLADKGYIDFAYIRPDSRGKGVFRQLYLKLEEYAVKSRAERLWVHASLMAHQPFEAMGFSVTKEETVEIRGEFLQRYEMEKKLV